LNLILIDAKVFERDIIQPRNYELVLVGQNYGENIALYPYWHSSNWKSPGLNLSSISSKRIDALLENLLVQRSKAEREEYYEAIGDILYDDKYAFFLFQPVYNFATESRIKGIKKEYLLYPEDRFRNINYWYINDKLILN
jgi:ABC-type transport system substrate-binding protein